MADKKCQDIVVSGVKKLLIAPLGAEKTAATDVGFTNGNVTLTAALEYTDVMVDQSLMPIRSVLTAANYTFAAPLAGMTLENLAMGLGVEFGEDGTASLPGERYYQVWFETDGPVNEAGKKPCGNFTFPNCAWAERRSWLSAVPKRKPTIWKARLSTAPRTVKT